MAKPNIIMSWGECLVEMGDTGADDALATTLTDVGYTNDRSTTIEAEDGEVLEAKASGGKVVAREEAEKRYTIKTRVKEPSDDLCTRLFGIEKKDVTNRTDLIQKTTLITKNQSVRITPSNVGAIGIEARKCQVSGKFGYSEEEGTFLDLEATVLYCQDGEYFRRFRTKAAGV